MAAGMLSGRPHSSPSQLITSTARPGSDDTSTAAASAACARLRRWRARVRRGPAEVCEREPRVCCMRRVPSLQGGSDAQAQQELRSAVQHGHLCWRTPWSGSWHRTPAAQLVRSARLTVAA